jgi:hypothetical protein
MSTNQAARMTALQLCPNPRIPFSRAANLAVCGKTRSLKGTGFSPYIRPSKIGGALAPEACLLLPIRLLFDLFPQPPGAPFSLDVNQVQAGNRAKPMIPESFSFHAVLQIIRTPGRTIERRGVVAMRVERISFPAMGRKPAIANMRETPSPPRKKRLRTGEERRTVHQFSHLAGWTAQLHRKSQVGRALYLLCV